MHQITERIFISGSQIVPVAGVSATLNVAVDLDRMDFNDGEYNKVGLIDGPGNMPGTLAAAVFTLNQMLERNNKIVVCCHMGVSRSVIVVATFLAWKSKTLTIDQAIGLVKTKHEEAEPCPALRDLAKIVLQEIRK